MLDFTAKTYFRTVRNHSKTCPFGWCACKFWMQSTYGRPPRPLQCSLYSSVHRHRLLSSFLLLSLALFLGRGLAPKMGREAEMELAGRAKL